MFFFFFCFVKATEVLLSMHASQARAPRRIRRLMMRRIGKNDIFVSRDEEMIWMISIPKHFCNNYVVF
uniref:Putative secreted protein n=1 Tax=Anopheles marajoara TaxID=58244 RepID=A0A2M4CFG0_9DIPT